MYVDVEIWVRDLESSLCMMVGMIGMIDRKDLTRTRVLCRSFVFCNALVERI